MSYRRERSESYIVSLIIYVRERSDTCHTGEREECVVYGESHHIREREE